MKLLLDTQVLIWWLQDDRRLSRAARDLIRKGEIPVFVSAATAWEMEIKRALGKLDVPSNLSGVLEKSRFVELPVRVAHTERLRDLPSVHRDPFDRIMVAQALTESLTLMSADPVFEHYPAAWIRADKT